MQQRARMLQTLRAFFAQREVLEVETPLLNRHAVTDRHIDSLPVSLDPAGAWLHTSPEYAMKRLLAAGSGPIYQVCKVFRAGEAGRRHNPEFTLLEWYRPGFDQHELMDEVEALVRELLGKQHDLGPTLRLSYRQLFDRYLQLDPFTVTTAELQHYAAQAAIEIVSHEALSRDDWLDLLLTHLIEPQLPRRSSRVYLRLPGQPGGAGPAAGGRRAHGGLSFRTLSGRAWSWPTVITNCWIRRSNASASKTIDASDRRRAGRCPTWIKKFPRRPGTRPARLRRCGPGPGSPADDRRRQG